MTSNSILDRKPLTGFSLTLTVFDLFYTHGRDWIEVTDSATPASLGAQCRECIFDLIGEVSDRDPDSDWAEILWPSDIARVDWEEVGHTIRDYYLDGCWQPDQEEDR